MPQKELNEIEGDKIDISLKIGCSIFNLNLIMHRKVIKLILHCQY